MSFRDWLAFWQSFVVAATLLLAAVSVHAQVSSQGRGQLTFMVGQGSGPVGGIARDVADQNRAAPESTLKHLGFRFVGGYQFADYFGAEAGVTHLGPFSSRAQYLSTDDVVADTSLVALEADLVGRLPLAPKFRLDLILGAVAEGLETKLSTAHGSALPVGQQNPVDTNHFGVTLGVDMEWRVAANTSLIIGYHAYPDVGSSSQIGSVKGTLSLIAGGVHVEF